MRGFNLLILTVLTLPLMILGEAYSREWLELFETEETVVYVQTDIFNNSDRYYYFEILSDYKTNNFDSGSMIEGVRVNCKASISGEWIPEFPHKYNLEHIPKPYIEIELSSTNIYKGRMGTGDKKTIAAGPSDHPLYGRDKKSWKYAESFALNRHIESVICGKNSWKPTKVYRRVLIEKDETVRRQALIDEIEDLKKDTETGTDAITIERFIRNVENGIYAQLSRQMVEQLFEGTPQKEGKIELENKKIEYVFDEDAITLSFTDDKGETTPITLPIGLYTF